jgi:hypothetical protein
MSNGEKTEASSEGFSFGSLEDVHETIQEDSPLPNLAAIEAQSASTVETAKAAEGHKDSLGVVFDPKIHAVNAQGEPSKTPLGKFRKRRGLSSVETQNKALIAQQQTAEQKAAARAAGQLAADLLIGSAVTILGNEWVPVGEGGKQEPAKFNEHENLRRAFGDYFVAKNISDFPPGIALSIAMTSYIMPRVVAGPETKSKLAKAKAWLVEKYENMRKKDAAQPDSGDNRERKDDTGKKAVSDEPPEATRHART